MDHNEGIEQCASCGTDEYMMAPEDYSAVLFCEPCLDRAGPAEWPYDDLGGSE